MRLSVLVLVFLAVDPSRSAWLSNHIGLPNPEEKLDAKANPHPLHIAQNRQIEVTRAESFRHRFEKAVLAGIRYSFVGAAVGGLYEIVLGDESETPSYWPAIIGATSLGLLGFMNRLRLKKNIPTSHSGFRTQMQVSSQAAGMSPTFTDLDDEYSGVASNGPNTSDEPLDPGERDLLGEYSEANPVPLELTYPVDVQLKPLNPIVGGLDDWLSRTFPNENMISAFTLKPYTVILTYETGRYLKSAFCETGNKGESTGRVIGRVTSEGLFWDGDGWVQRLPDQAFWIKLASMSSKLFSITSRKALLNIQDPIKKLSQTILSDVTTGKTRPGDISKSASTFGIYYAEDDAALAFHRIGTDLASIFHFQIVAKSPLAPKSVEAIAVEGANKEVCNILKSMNKLGQCFLAVNQRWFTRHYQTLESDHEAAWNMIRETTQMGFTVNSGITGALRMHVLLGSLTPEGAHPNIVNSWLSLDSLYKYSRCSSDPLTTYNTTASCIGSGIAAADNKERVSCGTSQPSIKDDTTGRWLFPVTPKPVTECQRPMVVGLDSSVYLEMEKFTPADRRVIKDSVNQGGLWGNARRWETFEESTGMFVGPIETRSRPLDKKFWFDDAIPVLSVGY